MYPSWMLHIMFPFSSRTPAKITKIFYDIGAMEGEKQI
jgi:hypothetical protein